MSKRKGTRNEHRTIALLEAAGYRCTRSAGSLGAWDVIGLSETDIVLAQVKTNRPPAPMERRILAEFPVPPNARKLLYVWMDRKRLPVVTVL